MATLTPLQAASPLDASDDSHLAFAAGSTNTVSRALDDTDADLASMDTLSWRVEYRQSGRTDDTLSLSIRIMNGATVLAAHDNTGFAQVVNNNVTNTVDQTTGPTAFNYVNTAASKATWDGATVELVQDYSQTKGGDNARIEVDFVEFTGTYTKAGLSATVNQVVETDTAQPVIPIQGDPLPKLWGASPLDADDDVRLLFTQSTTETLTRALDDTPANFQAMNTLSWEVQWRMVAELGSDDVVSLNIRIMNGATVLAALDDTGTFQQVTTGKNGTDTTTGPVAFGYVNQSADKTAWDGASIELRQSYGVFGTDDFARYEVDYANVVGSYDAGGLSATVNTATETDLAQPVTPALIRLVAQSTETDTSQPVIPSKTVTVGQAVESDLSQPITFIKTTPVAQVTEVDTSQPVTPVKSVTLTQPVESDFAQPITPQLGGGPQVIPVGQASEVDTSQPVSVSRAYGISQAAESDTSQPVTSHKTSPVTQATEVDTSNSVTSSKVKAVAQAAESDTSQPVSVDPQRRLVGQASETDLAQPVTTSAAVVVQQVVESDTAQAVTSTKVKGVTQATEVDTSNSVTSAKSVTLTHPTEVDTAQTVTPVSGEQVIPVAQVVEVDSSQSITSAKTKPVAQATTSSTAFPLTVSKSVTLTQSAESDLAQPVTVVTAHTVTVNTATETSTAFTVTSSKVKAVGQPSTLSTASTIEPVKSAIIVTAVETDTSQPLTHFKVKAVGQASETDTAHRLDGPDREVDFGSLATKWTMDDFQDTTTVIEASDIDLKWGADVVVLKWSAEDAIPTDLTTTNPDLKWESGTLLVEPAPSEVTV